MNFSLGYSNLTVHIVLSRVAAPPASISRLASASMPSQSPEAGPALAGQVPHRVRVGSRALFASISLLVIVGSGLAWATFKDFTAHVPRGAPVPALRTGEVDPDGGDQDILLIGNDTRAGATHAELKALHTGQDQGTVNADTMMVLHVPADGSAPTLVSFPRDSWVPIPGNGNGKINSAYPDAYNAARTHGRSERSAESAGILLTIKTIHALTGLHIDHYVQVSLLGFYRISEAIGGITVCLKHAQHDRYSGIDQPKGVSVIKGVQALAFVRQRHGLPQGDLDRIKRQQYFLKAAFRKIASAGTLLNPFKLRNLLSAVENSLLVDPGLDLLALARQFETLTSSKITFTTIPNDGPQTIYPDGVETAIVKVNRAAMGTFVAALSGKNNDPYDNATPASPSSVTVDVLNGTDIVHLAAHNAAALTRFGFRINAVDSTVSPTQVSQIEYPAGAAGEAKALAAMVPNVQAVMTPAVRRVTLVLGSDGRWVQGLAQQHRTRSGSSNTHHALGCIN